MKMMRPHCCMAGQREAWTAGALDGIAAPLHCHRNRITHSKQTQLQLHRQHNIIHTGSRNNYFPELLQCCCKAWRVDSGLVMTTAVANYSEKQAGFPCLYIMWETLQQLWVETASLCFTRTQIGFLRYGVLEALVSLGNAAVPP
mmetsp:Transcript_103813/g.201202  ORF Transcript_103813/g.201202 Transcript_103813/m.201202 type:complete len:144 (+) Transcript_103813:243-674(+)